MKINGIDSLMAVSSGGVVGTTLLNAVQTNPTNFQSAVGLITVLFQMFLMWRQTRIKERQAEKRKEQELKETLEQPVRLQTDAK
ncbi:hypothetical protein D3C71_50710 [compost metagenome]